MNQETVLLWGLTKELRLGVLSNTLLACLPGARNGSEHVCQLSKSSRRSWERAAPISTKLTFPVL